jgi:hypothetical protein
MRKEILDGVGLKRPAIDEPTDGLDHAKRQRLGADVPTTTTVSLLPAGSISYAQLFTLTVDPGAKGLNIRAIPAEMAARTLVHLLKFSVNKDELNHAINVRRLPLAPDWRCPEHIMGDIHIHNPASSNLAIFLLPQQSLPNIGTRVMKRKS